MPVTCRCGAEIQDGWKFCYACAGPLPTEEELAARAAAAGVAAAPPPDPQPSQRPALSEREGTPGRPVPAATGPARRTGRPAGRAGEEPAAYLLYAAILALSTWCVALGVGMVLPGPDGTDLPAAPRLLSLLAGVALFAAPETAAWPLARLLTGRPPGWDEAFRSASARFQRLFALRLAAVAGTFFLLLAAGLATL